MADYLGIRAASSTVRFSFTTHAASGAAVAPSSAFENADLDVYKDSTSTPRSSTAGITMTSPFNSTTGLHHVAIDLSDNTDAGFYAAGSFYTVVLTPDETVDSLAVVKVLAYFDIGVPVANVTQISGDSTAADNLELAYDDTAGAVPWVGITDQGTAQSATGTTIVLRAAASFADDTPIGSTVWAFGSTQGYWQSQVITDYVGATDTATVAGWTVTPSGTITYKVFGSAAGSGVAQTGDAYAIVNSGTHGNAALKTLIDVIEGQTDDIGVAGAGLSNITWNATWDAEVQSEVADALAVYDPPTRAEATTDVNSVLTVLGTPAGASVSVDVAAVKVDTAAILVDTGTTLDGKIDVIDGNVDDIETLLAATDADVTLIKAKTDPLTYTVANVLDANVQRVNDVAITGDGDGTPFDVA